MKNIIKEFKRKHIKELVLAEEQLEKDYKKGAYFDRNAKSPDSELICKWKHRIPKGWYGFSLGVIPEIWVKAIDNLLEEIEKACPNFEIHQIKLKFGGLRFYVQLNCKDEKISEYFHKEIGQLEELLRHPNLIY